MKILVIHASAGAGHFKAAESLYNGIRKSTEHNVVLADALDYSVPYFKGLYKKTYFFLVSKTPWLWGFFFGLLDIGWLQPVVRFARRLYNLANTGKLHRYLRDERFDYIIMTHFMPTEVAAALKRSKRISSRLITVITDFDVHRIWLADGIDHYCVASDWTKAKIEKLGVAGERVRVSGIPTDEKFAALADIGALKEKLGLKENVFTVLVATGSFGIGPIEEIVDTLSEFQVIVVCGHNEGLYQKLITKKYQLVKVLGLVDNMHELMAVSDAMVTKPGGLSIAEALVSQLALIFFNAIPGQETGNIKVLQSYEVGISGCGVARIGEELVRLKFSRDAFLTILKKTKALGRPNAVRDIISLIR
jgi:processive 1,2-diacylglycerol beta-glucosyltransferase